MKGWESDKRWSDKYLSEIKAILGRVLIGEPPIEEDQERNTDLIVLRMEAVRIGCRVRRAEGYQEKYGHEFTIRCGRPSGHKTELTKIIEGWGNYFFYGFGCADSEHLSRWTIADLCVFRGWFNRYMATHRGIWPGDWRQNHDGSSDFMIYSWSDLPPEFVVASSLDEVG